MAQTTVTLSGPEIASLFAGLGERARQLDYGRPLKTIALYLASEAKRCFDEGRSPDGTKWAPLKAPSKRRGGPSAKPLRDKGFLMASLVGNAVGSVQDVQGATLSWGTNLTSDKGFPYPSVHQHGNATTPARPFLGVTEQMRQRMTLIVIDWLERESRRR